MPISHAVLRGFFRLFSVDFFQNLRQMFSPKRCYNIYLIYSFALQWFIFPMGFYKLTTKNYKFSDFEFLNYKGLQKVWHYILFFV